MTRLSLPYPSRSALPPVWLVAVLALSLLVLSAPAQATSRIKDIVDIEGVRDNMLVGYGLVVGLNGTGDSLGGSPFTRESLIGMLERLGVNIRDTGLDTDNVAAVMVTATLPPFARQGTRIDVQTSSLGDAGSLLGGQLLVTPLIGADGEVYAVAQGPVTVGGFSAGGQAAQVTQGVPTAGRIPGGAIVEREIEFALADRDRLHLALRNPDFTTATRITRSINDAMGTRLARASDPATIELRIPPDRDVVGLITAIEQLTVDPDQPARVVIDESTGVIVMGENVRVSTVAIAQGNLTVRVTETPQVVQPNPLAEGDTAVVPRTDIAVDTGEGRQLGILGQSVSLQDLVQGLNALGVSPRDMISILQSIKAAGALQAEIAVM